MHHFQFRVATRIRRAHYSSTFSEGDGADCSEVKDWSIPLTFVCESAWLVGCANVNNLKIATQSELELTLAAPRIMLPTQKSGPKGPTEHELWADVGGGI